MKAPFSRWLPAIVHTRLLDIAKTSVARTAVAKTSIVRTSMATAAVARTQWLPTIGHAPVPRRAILAATGLTVAAAVAGGQVAADAGATGPVRPTAVAEAAAVHAQLGPARQGASIGQGKPVAGQGQAAAGQDAPAADNGKSDNGKSDNGKAAPQAGPSMDKLIPHGTQGQQSRIPLSGDQTDNAKAIVDTAKQMGLPERAAVIGVATSLQESKLDNLGHLGAANDHDSLGLFQQRPSSGWGRPEQVTDPHYAAAAFFNGLKQVPGWQDEPLTDAAQRVQVSAYPFAYAQWEQQAADIVHELWNE